MDNLDRLEELKSSLECAISDLDRKEDKYYYEEIKSIIDELKDDIKELEEKKSKEDEAELKELEREYWASQF